VTIRSKRYDLIDAALCACPSPSSPSLEYELRIESYEHLLTHINELLLHLYDALLVTAAAATTTSALHLRSVYSRAPPSADASDAARAERATTLQEMRIEQHASETPPSYMSAPADTDIVVEQRIVPDRGVRRGAAAVAAVAVASTDASHAGLCAYETVRVCELIAHFVCSPHRSG
jgi:hypothetical protein